MKMTQVQNIFNSTTKATEKVQLRYELLMAGVNYGKRIADVVVAKFPNGFSNAVSARIIKITESALTIALDIYAKGGVARRLRNEFETGFRIGLRNRFAECAHDSATLAGKDSKIG